MLARKWGANHNAVREQWEPDVKEVYGFTSARKMASVLVSSFFAKLKTKLFAAARTRVAGAGGICYGVGAGDRGPGPVPLRLPRRLNSSL